MRGGSGYRELHRKLVADFRFGWTNMIELMTTSGQAFLWL